MAALPSYETGHLHFFALMVTSSKIPRVHCFQPFVFFADLEDNRFVKVNLIIDDQSERRK